MGSTTRPVSGVKRVLCGVLELGRVFVAVAVVVDAVVGRVSLVLVLLALCADADVARERARDVAVDDVDEDVGFICASRPARRQAASAPEQI